MRWVRTGHWDREIAQRDPREDAQEIVSILANWVFPLEILVGMELAQLRTFSIPSISKLLHATREYECHGVKRLDDTRAIMIEIFRYPARSVEQKEMIEHLNAIHGLYHIENDDYLYVLSTFMFDPWLFIDRFGFRKLMPHEKEAFFYLYRDLGGRMGVNDIPETREAMWQWRLQYEAEEQRYAPSNEAVAKGFLSAVRETFPAPMGRSASELTLALLDDDAVLAALGLKAPSKAFKLAVQAAMARYARLSTYVNPFERSGVEGWPRIYEHYPTYPDGYERLELGPTRVLEILRRRRTHVQKSQRATVRKTTAAVRTARKRGRSIRSWIQDTNA